MYIWPNIIGALYPLREVRMNERLYISFFHTITFSLFFTYFKLQIIHFSLYMYTTTSHVNAIKHTLNSAHHRRLVYIYITELTREYLASQSDVNELAALLYSRYIPLATGKGAQLHYI